MYYKKKGELVSLVIITFLILVSGILFWQHDSISGAITIINPSLELEPQTVNGTFGTGIGLDAEELVTEINHVGLALVEDDGEDDFSTQNIGDGLFTGVINLSNADAQFNGVFASDNAGNAITFADLNNDGFADFVIGATGATANGNSAAGKVYVVYGPANEELNLSDADIVLNGVAEDVQAGNALSSGDFNNDGIDDLLIGAESANTANKGESYIIFGSLSLAQEINLSDANVTFEGIDHQDRSGSAVSSGDINCDGIEDILIGAPYATGGASYSGEMYVVYGSSILSGTIDLVDANVTFFSDSSSGFLTNRRGITTGDMNNDGFDDIYVVGTNNNGDGYFIYNNCSLSSSINLTVDVNFTMGGVGERAIVMGDINNDGYLDLIGGDYEFNNGTVNIFLGSADLSGSKYLSQDNITIEGLNSEQFGYDVAVGDYNGDDIIDLFVSANYEDTNGNIDSGALHIFYGPIVNGTNIYSNQSNVTFNGVSASDYAGALIVNDFNNDNSADILIGAYCADPNGNSQAGEVYLVNGLITCNYINFNTTLNQDISANGECFIINASNIYLDGNGHIITGNGSGVGINLTNVENVTIRNFNVLNFSEGIYFDNSANNNNFTDGVVGDNANLDINITNNGGSNNIFANVTFDKTSTSIGTSSSIFVKWYTDVYINDTSGNPLVSVNVTGYNLTNDLEQSQSTDVNGEARLSLIEYYQDNSGKTYHTNHTINVSKSLYSQSSQQINLTETNNTQLTYTLEVGCGEIGEDITFSPTTFNINGSCFTIGADNLVIDGAGLTILGNTSGAGINITGYNNITFTNFDIQNFSNGIYLGATNNTYFYNSEIGASHIKDVFVNDNAGVNNTFVNVTFDRDKTQIGTDSDIFVKWYVDILVMNNGFIVSDANVSAYNSSTELEVSQLTNATGQIQFTLLDFTETSTGKIHSTPHNITVNKTGYNLQSWEVNLTQTNSTFHQFDISGDLSCGTISSSILLQNQTIYQNGTCFTIGADNIIIHGGGTTLIGNGTGNGFHFAERTNVTLTNFNIVNFSNGLYSNGSDDCTFSSLTFNNNSVAMNWYNSSSNNFENGTITNSTEFDLTLAVGTDNYFTNITFNNTHLNISEDGHFTTRWFLDFEVTDVSDAVLEDVKITLFNAENETVDVVTSSATGIAQMIISEFFIDELGYIYLPPYHLTISKAGYIPETYSPLDIYEENQELDFSLTEISCGTTLTTDIVLTENLQSSGTCFVIGADNLTIDGAGYSINGTLSNDGIRSIDHTGLTITNLTITNMGQGINLVGTNTSTVRDVNCSGNDYGLILINSSDNAIYDSLFSNNNHNDIYVNSELETNNFLINDSFAPAEINVTGNANIFQKWYLEVNVVFGDEDYNLPLANVTAYFNSTGLTDESRLTNTNGLVNLEITETKINSSTTTYFPPHNLTVFYNHSAIGQVSNSTVINISETNNTEVELWLDITCTPPADNLEITSNTNLCPGVWELVDGGSYGVIKIASTANVTCIDTVLVGDGSGRAFVVRNAEDVQINGCTLQDYLIGVSPDNMEINGLVVNDISMSNVDIGISTSNLGESFTLSNFAIELTESGYGVGSQLDTDSNHLIENGTFSGGEKGIFFSGGTWNNARIHNVTFIGQGKTGYGIYKGKGSNNNITNCTFQDYRYGVYWYSGSNNNIYYNTFEDVREYNVWSVSSGNVFNTSVNITYVNESGNLTNATVAWGNSWDDYCELDLEDTNNDDYADSGDDYPYSPSTTDKVLGYVTDWGPKVLSCPSETPEEAREVRGSSGSKAETTETTEEIPTETPAKQPTLKKETQVGLTPDEIYLAEDVKKHLKTEATTTTTEQGTTLLVTLENTGTKSMQLFPEIFQEIDDPYFIVTKKTLGHENSFFSKLSHLSYSENSVAGRLLEATITNPEQILLAPGETVEKTLQINEGLAIPRQLKIQFTTFGETVYEKEIEIEQKALSGTAVDLDVENNLLDIYAVIVPAQISQQFEEYYAKQTNKLTGAAVYDKLQNRNEYKLELSLVKIVPDENKPSQNNLPGKYQLIQKIAKSFSQEKPNFNDLYGPYFIKKDQSLIFAQQLKYNPATYNSDYLIKTKIFLDDTPIVENEFEIEMK